MGDNLATILDIIDRAVAYRILKGERVLATTHVRALKARFASVQISLSDGEYACSIAFRAGAHFLLTPICS